VGVRVISDSFNILKYVILSGTKMIDFVAENDMSCTAKKNVIYLFKQSAYCLAFISR
jgi:hypothetical protein